MSFTPKANLSKLNFMRSVFMVEKCLISRQENIALWTLVAECIRKMNRFNMIPQISQYVARKSKTNSATF